MAPTDNDQNYVLRKIDSIESRFESQFTKIDQRLDQIVHLMQAVAMLQEREQKNAEAIVETKHLLKESFDKFDKSVERIHVRLDKIDDESEKDLNAMFEKTRDLDVKISAVDEKVSRWMNRGIGIWIGISALVVVVQTIGGFVLSSFKDEYLTTKAQIVEIAKRQNEIETDVSRINTSIRANHPPK